MSSVPLTHAAGDAFAETASTILLTPEEAVTIRELSLVAGEHSVPEPDLAVVPGLPGDYDMQHPESAFLVVEVADGSLAQDQITKAAIYASAGVGEYWIVNLRDDVVEIYRSPDTEARCYREHRVAGANEQLTIVALPGASVAVDDLVPKRASAPRAE